MAPATRRNPNPTPLTLTPGVLLRLAPLWALPPVASGEELLHAYELQSPAEYKVLHPLVKVRG